jgi:hypothetical protein
MRDSETIDSELRLLAAIRGVCREHGEVVDTSPMYGCASSKTRKRSQVLVQVWDNGQMARRQYIGSHPELFA